MGDEPEEPTNEQLAKFLVLYAPHVVGAENLQLNEGMIKELLDGNPIYRMTALRRHEEFIKETTRHFEKMAKGQLQCDFVRQNGRRCPNWNEPGSFFCGLHKPIEVEVAQE